MHMSSMRNKAYFCIKPTVPDNLLLIVVAHLTYQLPVLIITKSTLRVPTIFVISKTIASRG